MANAEIGSSVGNLEQLPDPLLDLISEIPWCADASGELTWIHPASKNLYGYSADQLTDNPRLRTESIHDDDRDRVIELIRGLPQTRCQSYDFRVVDSSNRVHRVHETIYYQTHESKPATICGLTRVITDRRNRSCLRFRPGRYYDRVFSR